MKQDRRVLRTRTALQQAYLRLIENYEEHDITVSMITEEADINRATFYAHFSNKEDFLEEMLYELLEGFEKEMLAVFKGQKQIDISTVTPTTEVMFQYIEDHKSAFYALSKGHKDFQQRMEKLFHYLFTEKIYIETESPLGKVNYDIFIHYQTKATLGLIYYWLRSNFKYSKAYMMEQLTILSNTTIKYLIKK